MRDNCSWLLNIRGNQKCRPIDRMKAKYVLADKVQRRPKLLKTDGPLAFFIPKTDGGDVVRERIEPNVHRMVGIVGHRQSPGNRTFQTADGKVLQAAANKALHFIVS